MTRSAFHPTKRGPRKRGRHDPLFRTGIHGRSDPLPGTRQPDRLRPSRRLRRSAPHRRTGHPGIPVIRIIPIHLIARRLAERVPAHPGQGKSGSTGSGPFERAGSGRQVPATTGSVGRGGVQDCVGDQRHRHVSLQADHAFAARMWCVLSARSGRALQATTACAWSPLKSAGVLASQIATSLSHKQLVHQPTQKRIGTITVSVGVAQARSSDTLVSLFERADTALYAAKSRDRSQVVLEGP